jgi:lipoprotein-releasing system permease protein
MAARRGNSADILVPKFELFVALRYLRAKRKETAVSLVTAISILGVAAGVTALIVALAINAGFRTMLQKNLLGATAHISVLERVPQYGIQNWRALADQLEITPGVASVQPSLYQALYLSGPAIGTGAILKGISPDRKPTLEALQRLKKGDFQDLKTKQKPGFFPVILGSELARQSGLKVGAEGFVVVPNGELTAFGAKPAMRRFVCVGIFESGFFALDSAWAFTTLEAARSAMSYEDVVNSIELTLDDPDQAAEVSKRIQPILGDKLDAETWFDQNKQLLGALKMERVVSVITIGLIQLIAALNILIALTMMVMEKRKDIAILMSMGCRLDQVRRIFMLQGILIGVAGTLIGLLAGYLLCFFADRGRWIQLDEAVYAVSYVPFHTSLWDGLWVTAIALAVSFLATLWPARNAAKVAPVETLRYE